MNGRPLWLCARRLGVELALFASLLGCASAHGQTSTFSITGVEVGLNGEVQVSFPADPQARYILYRGNSPESVEEAVAMASFPEGPGNLADRTSRPPDEPAFYRVLLVPEGTPHDADRDGMDDAYELAYSQVLDPLNPFDALLDQDGDGVHAWSESRLGTDPAHFDAPPRVSSAFHNLLVQRDGTLWAWGSNQYGEIGNNSFEDQPMLLRIGTHTNSKMASAGSSFSLELRSDGTMWGWGRNKYGETGTGSTNDTVSIPTRIGTDDDWAFVSGGHYGALALKRDHTLWAWGATRSHVYPDAASQDQLSPVQVSPDAVWSVVAAGDYGCLGIQTNGTLWGWGNRVGPLTAPVQVGWDRDWRVVATGWHLMHQLAIRADGSLWYIDFPQSTTNRLVARRIGSDEDWIDVATGWKDLTALKDDGTLWSWEQESWEDEHVPVEVGTAAHWRSMSAGSHHWTALDEQGGLWTWGDNERSALGNGSLAKRQQPYPCHPGTNWVRVSAGGTFCLALQNDGSLWSWGRGLEAGHGDTIDRAVPTRITTLSNITAFSSHGYHFLALSSNGDLWASGQNSSGELGDGTENNRLAPVLIDTNPGWREVYAGLYCSFGLKHDGTLWAWGSNFGGLLGDGTEVDRNRPVQIGLERDWAWISTSLAVKSNGTLWAWGSNSSYRFGDANYSSSLVPVKVTAASDWAKVTSTLPYTAFGIKTNGTLWAWGRNHFEDLGLGDSEPRPVPVRLTDFSDWTNVRSAVYHNFGRRANGTVWGWGNNSKRQLASDRPSGMPPMPVAEAFTWRDIAGSTFFSVAVNSDGTLWTWGANGFGVRGDGTFGFVAEPTLITNVASVSETSPSALQE